MQVLFVCVCMCEEKKINPVHETGGVHRIVFFLQIYFAAYISLARKTEKPHVHGKERAKTNPNDHSGSFVSSLDFFFPSLQCILGLDR